MFRLANLKKGFLRGTKRICIAPSFHNCVHSSFNQTTLFPSFLFILICLSKYCFFFLVVSYLLLRARIETSSSISEKLQCGQRIICETVGDPYGVDDYVQRLAEQMGTKGEAGGLSSQRTQSQPQAQAQTQPEPTALSSVPPHLYKLNPFGTATGNSHYLKVQQVSLPLLQILPSLALSLPFSFSLFRVTGA